MTLDLELTKDQGSFLFVCTLREGRFFIVHTGNVWYIESKEGGEEIEDSVY